MRSRIFWLIVVICVLPGQVILGQDLNPFARFQKLKDADPFKLQGFFSTTLLTNTTSNPNRTADPFNYRLNAGLTLQSYGITTQFSLHYADRNRVYRFTQPTVELPSYAFWGISPTYKSVTLHLGTRSMDFSRYSMAGHSFQGIGMVLNPKKWRISGMYGQLRRASVNDFNSLQSLDPVFKRMGWGVKIGYETPVDAIALVLFSAQEIGETTFLSTEDRVLTPADNDIVSLVGKKKVGNRIHILFDYAWSAYTRDKNQAENTNLEGISLLDRIGGLHRPRLSSSFQKALFTRLQLKSKIGAIRFTHERVDPNYRTMGALFFNNDFENISAGIQGSSSQNWTYGADLGYQRTNLDGKEINTSNRVIAALKAGYKPSDRTHFNFQFSNFSTTQKISISNLPFIETDSIALTLVNRSAGITFSHNRGKNNQSSWTTSLQFQQAQSIQNDLVTIDQTSSNLFGLLRYQHRFAISGWSTYGQWQFNRMKGFLSDITSIGPTLGIQKSWRKNQVRTQASIAWLDTYTGGERSNRFIRPQLQIGIKTIARQELNLITNYLWRESSLGAPTFSEYNARLRYQVRW